VSDVANLERAFSEITDRHIQQARPLSGGLRDIQLHLADRLRELSDEVAGGAWAPAPLRKARIRKSDESWRTLRVPPIRDRIVERALASVISEAVDPDLSPWSFAYRKGLGVADAIRAAKDLRSAGLGVVIRTDIEDCFDSIPRSIAMAEVHRRFDDPWLLQTVETLLERPVWGEPERTSSVRGIPQGAPLSPLLANLVLDRLDTELPCRGFHCLRYADDLLVAVESQADVPGAATAVREVLSTLGLSMNDEKLVVTTFEDGVFFLGEELGPATLEEELIDLASRLRREDRKALYVTRQGAYVSSRQGQVRVTDNDEVLLSVPISMVNPLVLCGAVGMSSGLRSAALYDGIDVVFLSKRGRYLGRLDSADARSARLVRDQFATSADATRSLHLTRELVAGKVANLRALVMRYARREAIPHTQGAVRALLEHRRAALAAETIEQLMGLEGIAARTYFGVLTHIVPDWTMFSGRNRRPPRDPVNAVLSYGYALLLGEAVAAVRVAGLDPSCGFLHRDNDRRPSLALDLMEEFRPLIVDTVTLELFRRRQLKAEDFITEGSAVMLRDAARRVVVEAMEHRFISEFAHLSTFA
jgi:CRISPR-associated protein Cas1